MPLFCMAIVFVALLQHVVDGLSQPGKTLFCRLFKDGSSQDANRKNGIPCQDAGCVGKGRIARKQFGQSKDG